MPDSLNVWVSGANTLSLWTNRFVEWGISLALPTPSRKASLAVSERRIVGRCSEIMPFS